MGQLGLLTVHFLTETLNTKTFLLENRHQLEGMRCGSKLTRHRSLSHHSASTPSHTHTHTDEEDDKGLCVISISGNFIQKEEEEGIPA